MYHDNRHYNKISLYAKKDCMNWANELGNLQIYFECYYQNGWSRILELNEMITGLKNMVH